jgi:hypothetical protein
LQGRALFLLTAVRDQGRNTRVFAGDLGARFFAEKSPPEGSQRSLNFDSESFTAVSSSQANPMIFPSKTDLGLKPIKGDFVEFRPSRRL